MDIFDEAAEVLGSNLPIKEKFEKFVLLQTEAALADDMDTFMSIERMKMCTLNNKAKGLEEDGR